MTFPQNTNFLRWLIIIASFIIISLILWNTYVFFQNFKAEERAKMDIWAKAQIEFQKSSLTENINPIISKIISSDSLNPKIVVYKDNRMSTVNIKGVRANDSLYLQQLVLKFENENTPIELSYIDPRTNQKVEVGTLYYGDSSVLNKLKYYPLALLLIILLFGAVVYFFYKSSKVASQNKLWSGMAKETAHQIGTPLSSLIGWAEILKSENVNPDYINEIEKDIERLQTITDRFSKIGSMPTLEKIDIVKTTAESYDYIKSRSSKHIDFEFNAPNTAINVNLNVQLYSWTIENLVKNAIDAMKGKGELKIEILPKGNLVHIRVSDTGKGMPKKLFYKIFDTGFTTKKRGWGLGLSLAKRIIEDYHKGKIKVLSSEIDKGTTIQISLKQL
ncbi:MAG: HAMP domain-containing histidine kinase [Bacteroidetes bacterium]|nr:HAMP domain-containing histidine kinase [Bacteroidota bacterium]